MYGHLCPIQLDLTSSRPWQCIPRKRTNMPASAISLIWNRLHGLAQQRFSWAGHRPRGGSGFSPEGVSGTSVHRARNISTARSGRKARSWRLFLPTGQKLNARPMDQTLRSIVSSSMAAGRVALPVVVPAPVPAFGAVTSLTCPGTLRS